MKEKQDTGSYEQLLKQNNLSESHLDAFKTGFTEGFMKAQALTRRNQGHTLNAHLLNSKKCVLINEFVLTSSVFNRLCKEDTFDYFCPPAGGPVWCVKKPALLG